MPKTKKKMKAQYKEQRMHCDNCPLDRNKSCDDSNWNLPEFGRDEIERDLIRAISMIFNNDRDLLGRDIHERTICFYLAHYFIDLLKDKYRGYNIDPEYNRNGKEAKYYYDDYGYKTYAIPDLIIHKRNCNKYNLLYLELKKNIFDLYDCKKIKKFMNDTLDPSWGGHNKPTLYKFKNGVNVVISSSSVKLTWYLRDDNIWIQNEYNYRNNTLDEDLLEKYDPTVTIKRLAVIAFLVLMLPIMMDGFSGLTSEATSDIGQIITGIDIETKPSKVILSAGYSNGDASATKNLDFKEVDINEIDEASDDYALYPELFDLVFAFISSIISCVIFVFVGIQISQRIVGLLLKILISPFALSGVIDPGDNTFSIWTKLCVADFLTTFFQILLVMLVITVSTVVPLSNPIAKTVFFIGALMAIMNAPTGIAQLLGGDVGTGTAFQQVQSLMMLGTGVQLAGSAMSAISAGGFYGAGRWLGGRSLIGSGLAGTAMNNGIRPDSSSGSMGYPGGGAFSSASTGNMQAGAEMPATNISSDVSDSGVIGSQASGFRMTNPDSVLGRIADFNAQDGPGSMVNRAASSLYMRSAQRLSRPVQYRSVRGGVGVRQSRIVSTSRALHETANNLHHLGNAANEESNRR